MDTALLPGDRSDPRFAGRYPLQILVADDDYTSRRLLLLMLRSLGYNADARENGKECYEAVLSHAYDILLSDVDMPEMSGIDCTRAIRQAGIDLPVIAITASAPETARPECLQAGMMDFMRKPVSFSELKRSLREVALRKWLRQANLAVTHASWESSLQPGSRISQTLPLFPPLELHHLTIDSVH